MKIIDVIEKNKKEIIIPYFISTTLIYLTIAYIELNYNPIDWDLKYRSIYGAINLINTSTALYFIYKKINYENNR
jgi:hypothetical protein